MPSFVIKDQQFIVKPEKQAAKYSAVSVPAWENSTDGISLSFLFLPISNFPLEILQYQKINIYNWRHKKAVNSTQPSGKSVLLRWWHTCTDFVQLVCYVHQKLQKFFCWIANI